ncbi:MAG: FdtA/QdtA family cupin domain-containing protein [Xanthobacteraceae bacterium]
MIGKITPISEASHASSPPVKGRLSSIARIRLIELPCHSRDDGEVVVAQVAAQVAFPIARVFTVTAPLDALRGEHAHIRCTQFMLCVHGAVEIVCDDGHEKRTFHLNRNNLALCVPPAIWNNIFFRHDRSVVMVLCDRPFEEDDYLRDYSKFLAFRKANS